MKYTRYFKAMRQRPDRAMIELEWIKWVVRQAVKEMIQQDGRIRCWALIPEAGGKYLRLDSAARRRSSS